jgi:hypothetical protein
MLLLDRTIYCSDPATFNDPWDCKPHFNTEVLDNPVEHERHVQWAVDVCRRHNNSISPQNIDRMKAQLQVDRQLLAKTLQELSQEMWAAISTRYRVYCLGPDAGSLLMWAHYADNHKGICLEFSTRNNVMCCPLRVEYPRQFPVVRAYSAVDAENLQPLLTKADVWTYEHEYRLIAQERGNATCHGTLMTDNNFLKLPENTLLSIIVGCQGPYDEVQNLVSDMAPGVLVKRAERVPNRFELRIS